MKPADLKVRFLAFIDAFRASDAPAAWGRAELALANFNADVFGGNTVAGAVLDTLQEQYVMEERCPETGSPFGYRPRDVPEALVAERDALLGAAAEMQALEDQVSAAESAAGWDPNP